MQEALRGRRQAADQRPTDAENARETPEQRERRLSNQAWLQRVLDDPGALLRARFLREAQRRSGETQ